MMKTLNPYNKYGNRKTVIDGIKFDSMKEANRYCELLMLQKAGFIQDLELQPEYELQAAFEKNGKKYRKITYKADFSYFDVKANKVIVEDVKSEATRENKVYILKKKIFEYRYMNLTIKET